jgi:hypothetical protein
MRENDDNMSNHFCKKDKTRWSLMDTQSNVIDKNNALNKTQCSHFPYDFEEMLCN